MRRSSDSPLAVRVRTYLDAHAEQRVTLDRLAGVLGTSVRSMTRQFRKHYGVSVRAYITQHRVTHAVRLLEATDLKI